MKEEEEGEKGGKKNLSPLSYFSILLDPDRYFSDEEAEKCA